LFEYEKIYGNLITLIGLRQVWIASEAQDVPVGMLIASVRDGAAHIEEMDVCWRTADDG
jgi:hypothetical protein